MATTYSYSRLTSYHNCEYGFYLHYILGLPSEQNIYGFMGGVTHELLERMQVGELTAEQAINEFNLKMQESESLGMKFPSASIETSYRAAVTDYLRRYKPYDGAHIEIEKEFKLTFGNVELLGFIDLVVIKGDGHALVIDHKTSSKYSKADKAKHGRQLVIYALALEQMGYKVDYIGWSMLKYAHVKVGQGRSRQVARNKIGVEFMSQIKEKLELGGFVGAECYAILDYMVTTGDVSKLPDFVKDEIEVTPLMVEYEYTEETKQDALKFISETASEIEFKELFNDESLWEPKDIAKSDFFCTHLCGQRKNCHFYKEYKDSTWSYKDLF